MGVVLRVYVYVRSAGHLLLCAYILSTYSERNSVVNYGMHSYAWIAHTAIVHMVCDILCLQLSSMSWQEEV